MFCVLINMFMSKSKKLIDIKKYREFLISHKKNTNKNELK